MRKVLLAATCLWMCTLSMHAEKVYSLVIYQIDGSKTSYAFTEKIKVEQQDESTLLLTTAHVSMEYPISKIEKFTHEMAESDVSTIEEVTTCNTNNEVRVYSTDGKLVKQMAADANHETRLLIGDLPQGTYIVKSGDVCYKLMKR